MRSQNQHSMQLFCCNFYFLLIFAVFIFFYILYIFFLTLITFPLLFDCARTFIMMQLRNWRIAERIIIKASRFTLFTRLLKCCLYFFFIFYAQLKIEFNSKLLPTERKRRKYIKKITNLDNSIMEFNDERVRVSSVIINSINLSIISLCDGKVVTWQDFRSTKKKLRTTI